MNSASDTSLAPARIEYLKVQNFRALRELEFKELTPLTVLLGPNGSGKSTVFDVFAFLSECFELGLRRAWDKRGRAKELKTRGGDGPVVIEVKYKEPGYPLISYHLAVDERNGAPVVVEEWLQWRRGQRGETVNKITGYHPSRAIREARASVRKHLKARSGASDGRVRVCDVRCSHL